MKTRFVSIIVLLVVLTVCLTGCSGNPDLKVTNNSATTVKNITVPIDQGETNDTAYADYSFWESPIELRLVTDFKVNFAEDDTIEPEGSSYRSPSKIEMTVIEGLRSGIIDFFKKNYSIDVTKRLSMQEIRIADFSQNNIYMATLGFNDSTNRNLIWLDSALCTDEYVFLFKQIYVHETLHGLGINNESDGFLVEGITDALVDQIMTSMGYVFYETEAYFESRVLAYQLLAADREIPVLYMTQKNFSLKQRICERLKAYPQTNEETSNPGQKLIDILSIAFSIRDGFIEEDFDVFPYIYDAQEIVQKYCQSFNLNNSIIDYIRKHYLISDFEDCGPDMFYYEDEDYEW